MECVPGRETCSNFNYRDNQERSSAKPWVSHRGSKFNYTDGSEMKISAVATNEVDSLQIALVVHPMVDVHVIAMNGDTLIKAAFRAHSPLARVVQTITEETGIERSQICLLADHPDHVGFLKRQRNSMRVQW